MAIHYYSYYLELKNRLLLLLLTCISVNIVCYFYKEFLIFVIIDTTNYIGFLKTDPYFIFSDVTDLFSVYIRLIFFFSNQICFFVFLYHFLTFLSPGLYFFEYKNFNVILKTSCFCWIFSIYVLNYILLPFSWGFFLSFVEETSTISFVFEANFKKYFDYYTNLYYLCVFNFQMSILVLLVINSISNNLNKIKSFRKLFYFLFIFFSTAVTPPDVFSQLLLSFCFICVYESLIFLKILDKTIDSDSLSIRQPVKTY